jgi:hypothetical protein
MQRSQLEAMQSKQQAEEDIDKNKRMLQELA